MARKDWASVLLIRLSSLGDVARMLPSVRALRESGLGVVDVTTEDRFAPLFDLFPLATRVVPYPRKTPGAPGRHPVAWAGAFSSYVRELRSRPYDLALDLHGIVRSALVGQLAKAGETAGYAKGFGKEFSHLLYGRAVAPAEQTHISRYERYAGTLAALGFDRPRDAFLAPTLPETALCAVRDFLAEQGLEPGRFLFLFVGTSRAQARKRWPLERFVELAGLAADALGLPSVIGWGPEEAEEVAPLRHTQGMHLIPDWRLPELLAVIRSSSAFVGADTGAMHISALIGIPTVAVLGPTDPVLNRPFGERARIVRRDGITRACGGEGCTHARCMGAIPAGDVLAALRELLGQA